VGYQLTNFSYRYSVDEGISLLGEEPGAFFPRQTNPVVICLQRSANSYISPVLKLPVKHDAVFAASFLTVFKGQSSRTTILSHPLFDDCDYYNADKRQSNIVLMQWFYHLLNLASSSSH